ncbi:Protease [Bienertia sinuspersici]
MAPYHENRYWMLAIISPWRRLVYWLDPTGSENEVREFAQRIIYEGLMKFSMVHRKDLTKIKKNPKVGWKKLKDCGYYVCRYMLETIESRQQLIPDEEVVMHILNMNFVRAMEDQGGPVEVVVFVQQIRVDKGRVADCRGGCRDCERVVRKWEEMKRRVGGRVGQGRGRKEVLRAIGR